MSNMSVNYVGTLNGLYKVYIDPFFVKDKILMGCRPESWKYAVGYFAPYIPLFISDKYINGTDFSQLIQGCMSRYAYGIIPEAATGGDALINNGLATITVSSS